MLYYNNANKPPIFGQEYLSAFHKKLLTNTTTKLIFSGDSTTFGFSDDPGFTIDALIQGLVQKIGLSVTTINSGQSGKETNDWLTTYLSGDLSQNPDVYILRWGLNDPYCGRDSSFFEKTLRVGLANIRASRPLSSLSIILMTPNSTNDTFYGRDRNWHEIINPIVRKAARDYQCCFIDTFMLLNDSDHASDWMDAPYSNNIHIHPLDVMNTWISSIIFEVLIPIYFRNKFTQMVIPTLLNNWANYGSTNASAGYYKDSNNRVHLRGTVKNGVIGQPIFNFPAGYRTSAQLGFPVVSNAAFGVLGITSTGDLICYAGNNSSLYLDGISFLADC